MEHSSNEYRISRRGFLSGVAVSAMAAGVVGTSPFTAASAQAATTFAKGADVSWVPQMEATGYTWYNSSGVQQDILQILKGYGMSAVRLRTWVNPSSDPVDGHCSADETVAFAKRCRDAGFNISIDPHFGDTWNSVGKQNPPAAWASMTYSQMRQAMYDYMYHLMNLLKYAGVTPKWVQLGNETNLGICGTTGSISRNPTQMIGLLNAAHDIVKQVFPQAQTVIHLAQPQNTSTIQNWLDTYANGGGQWDVTGFSSYASGTSTIDGILANYADWQTRYGKPVMQVEFGGQYTKGANVKADLSHFLSGVRDLGGVGFLYWEPEEYIPFDTYTMGAWNPDTKKPTAALDGFLV